MIRCPRTYPAAAAILLLLASCGTDAGAPAAADLGPRTPVTITHVQRDTIAKSVLLNATSQFLRKNSVRANITGTVDRAFVALGDHVRAGQPLYVIRTKEAEALGAFAAQDSTFRVKGLITITAASDGVIVQMDKLLNDYVYDGDQLAIIADGGSSVFVVTVPYELNAHAGLGTPCTIMLPDSTQVRGTITTRLSTVDALAQTQGFVVKPTNGASFPEGLIGTVRFSVQEHPNAQVVPATTVLGNEEMTTFWEMRLIDDSTAVRVPIERGIAANDRVELLTPIFAPGDRLLLTGGYGLGDTARIFITAP